MKQNYVKIIALFIMLFFVASCAQNETTTRASKGAATGGAVGMVVGGPQRAAVSAVSGAASRVVGGKIKDEVEE